MSSLLESFKKGVLSCRDAIITCVVNTLTCLLAGCVTFSILGHIAQEQQTQVSEVVKSGPGLVFLTYPEVVLKLPGASLWAIIFFVMLLVRNCYSDDGIGSRRLCLLICVAVKRVWTRCRPQQEASFDASCFNCRTVCSLCRESSRSVCGKQNVKERKKLFKRIFYDLKYIFDSGFEFS